MGLPSVTTDIQSQQLDDICIMLWVPGGLKGLACVRPLYFHDIVNNNFSDVHGVCPAKQSLCHPSQRKCDQVLTTATNQHETYHLKPWGPSHSCRCLACGLCVTYMHARTHTHKHIHTHAHTYTLTHTGTYTHTDSLSLPPCLSLSPPPLFHTPLTNVHTLTHTPCIHT
jgi:hypothetical protein